MKNALRRPLLTNAGLHTKNLLLLSLTSFFMLAACLQVSAGGNEQKITLSEKNVPLEKVFREITKQSGYYFLYNNQQLQKVKKVSVEVKDASVREVLDECLKEQPITYTIIEQTIVIKPREEKLIAAPAP